MAKYQVQVKASEWAGRLTDWRWVPAVDGTFNATGHSAEEASTFDALECANAVESFLAKACRGDSVEFRVVEVTS